MTTTWSNSRPFVACAVARVSGASSRRSSASRARVARIAAGERRDVVEPDRPAEERRRDLARGGLGRVVTQPAEADQQRLVVGRPSASTVARSSSIQRRFDQQVDPRRPERQPEVERDDDRRQQLAVGPGEDRPRRSVVGPRPDDPFEADRLVRRVRREDQPTRRRRPGADRLVEPLRVVLDEPDRPLDDGPRAAVVDLEVDPPQPRELRRQTEDPPDVGQPPAVDRLVVVADEEDPVGRGRQEEREAELAAVHVLDLVDQQLLAPRPPPGEQRRVRLEALDRAQDEVVEVEAAATPGPRPRRRRTPARRDPRRGRAATCAASTPSSIFSREITVSSRTRSAASAHGATAARTAARSASGSTATPASRRISRPSAWNVRTRTPPGATPSGASAASSRSVISTAARLLKVIARMPSGGVPVAMSQAARATRVVVLPLPAGAMHKDGPGGAVAAARWSGASRARRSATAG